MKLRKEAKCLEEFSFVVILTKILYCDGFKKVLEICKNVKILFNVIF
jgi:hypothetical protein